MSGRFPRIPVSVAVSLLSILASAAFLPALQGPSTAKRATGTDLASFDRVWETIRDKHWDPGLGGLDWEAVYAELRPRIEQAPSSAAAREVIREMVARLRQSHFAIIPAAVYGALGHDGGEFPARGAAGAGLDLRVIGEEILVTRIDRSSSAEERGVRTGWRIARIGDEDLAPVIARVRSLFADSTSLDFHLRRAVQSRLTGPPGGRLDVTFVDGTDTVRRVQLDLRPPRGRAARFGHLAPSHVWFEFRRLEDRFGYIAFNEFMDPANLMSDFEAAVQDCLSCDGILLDLRGNPGGIGAMSIGMAGWFISTPGRRLGTMITRQTPLNFVVNPRVRTFDGPLAVLADGCSASTSEVLAGGLQDLGRAKVFGSRTAGAALPSLFEKLPNGDLFQYAVANYVSEGGRTLEGVGVQPDCEVQPTREALLAGRDPVIEAALEWLKTGKIPM